jgi:hypothetical protein
MRHSSHVILFLTVYLEVIASLDDHDIRLESINQDNDVIGGDVSMATARSVGATVANNVPSSLADRNRLRSMSNGDNDDGDGETSNKSVSDNTYHVIEPTNRKSVFDSLI